MFSIQEYYKIAILILRQLGYKIGITTFYNKNVFSVIDKSLKLNGIVYDNVVCHNDVILGKPKTSLFLFWTTYIIPYAPKLAFLLILFIFIDMAFYLH